MNSRQRRALHGSGIIKPALRPGSITTAVSVNKETKEAASIARLAAICELSPEERDQAAEALQASADETSH